MGSQQAKWVRKSKKKVSNGFQGKMLPNSYKKKNENYTILKLPFPYCAVEKLEKKCFAYKTHKNIVKLYLNFYENVELRVRKMSS